MSENEQARTEIANFLLAMHSYPDRFAQDPRITFEEYRSSFIEAPKPHSRGPA